MTYKEMAEDVIRYADHNKLERFTLIGHSMGGKTAMTLAMLHPDRVDGVIVVDASARSAVKDKRYGTRTDDLVITPICIGIIGEKLDRVRRRERNVKVQGDEPSEHPVLQ
eukprot:TRINITY_DN1658_c0_g1_i1.p5 TRINITY_DN1658_c0_g1~~TRINITY_DN1658_c0_g1_i1.p5  ORF type:complete len:110 (+),score=0.88 TRINITY_DN1658_c0_g1_i1:593-922(+)